MNAATTPLPVADDDQVPTAATDPFGSINASRTSALHLMCRRLYGGAQAGSAWQDRPGTEPHVRIGAATADDEPWIVSSYVQAPRLVMPGITDYQPLWSGIRFVSVVRPLVANRNDIDIASEKKFAERITNLLADASVEDGFAHPAETALQGTLAARGLVGAGWIQALFFSLYRTRPSLAADLLRCVGRLERKRVEAWGWSMVMAGLAHPEPAVRDAALRALEQWGGPQSIALLKWHLDREPVDWLVDYIRQLLIDLGG